LLTAKIKDHMFSWS